jgi:hypothetical protein
VWTPRLTRPTRRATVRFTLGYLVGLAGSGTPFVVGLVAGPEPDLDLGVFAVLMHVGLGVIGLAAAMIDPGFRGLASAWLGVTTVLVLFLAVSSDSDLGILGLALASAMYFAWPMIIGFAVGSVARRRVGLPPAKSWIVRHHHWRTFIPFI